MIVLHYIDKFDVNTKLGSEFISVLCKGMSDYAESHVVTRNYVNNKACEGLDIHIIGKDNGLLGALYDIMPDVVHIHGCWSYSTARFLLSAHRRGFYTVWSPHGGLQPWILKKKFWKQKLPRILSYLFLAAHRADMIHVTGAIEEKNIRSLHWNKKISLVKNALVTQETTIGNMSKEMCAVYQSIIDLHIKNEITISTQQAFYTLLKAGLLIQDRDYRPGLNSISKAELDNFTLLKYKDWRNLSIFAEREHVNEIISAGMEILGVDNIMNIPSGTKIIPSPKNADDIKNCIVQLKKKVWKRQLSIKNMTELYSLLRYNDYNDEELIDKLRQKGQKKFATRLEYILTEMFGLEEGFMPLPARNDSFTNILKNMINN